MTATAIIKLDPGADVTDGILDAHRELGWDSAVIISGMGSIRNAKLEYLSADGTIGITAVDGPGLEVASVTGLVQVSDSVTAQPVFNAVVCDRHGTTFGGRLKPGCNKVCVTFEVISLRM